MPIVHHRKPSFGSYLLWFGSRIFIKPLLSLWPVNGLGLAGLFLVDRLAAIGPKPKGVVREQMRLADRRVELIMPAGPSRRDSDSAILYLHGGAFIVCGLGTHRSIAARLARETELPVFALEYRQLPQAGVGTSVDDAITAYTELVTERGYRRVIVAGDSAGGFLAGVGRPRPTSGIRRSSTSISATTRIARAARTPTCRRANCGSSPRCSTGGRCR